MKRTVLSWASTLMLILFGLITQAQAQCAGTKSDECFDFNFKGVTKNTDGTVTLSFGVKVNCNRDLSHASFELPSGAKAISATGPTNGYENGTNNPFYSVKFNTGSGYKNGRTADFSYTISAADFSRMTTLRAEAKASTTVGMVTFDLKNCSPTGGGNNGGDNCKDSQPRPIIGEQHPCAGDVVTYCIENDRNYTSFEWDVPRAHAGEPPVGWEIISGQGTSCVTVRVGQKSGTMKVKVNDPICGTKVATLPVKPGKNFEVAISGPDSICVKQAQAYTASVKKTNGNGNGNGNAKGEFKFTWTVPADWTIQSGQGTDKIVVIPGATDGEVNVYVTDETKPSGNGNNGNGVGGSKNGYCGTASDQLLVETNENCGGGGVCQVPTVRLVAPDTICNLADEPTTIRVAEMQEGVTYTFTVPEGFIVLEEGAGFVTVVAVFEEAQLGQAQTISVTATNECGTQTANASIVVADCGIGNPLPVTLTRFEGASRSGAVVLAWSTASEKNNDRFEIERSINGKDFKKVGEVKGNGNSSATVDYSYTDRNAASGTVYYRLRQVDFDNAFEYSKVIAVSHAATASNNAAVSVYPNPVSDGRVSIRFQDQVKGSATVRLVDVSGRVLHTQEVASVEGEIALNLTSLNLKAGIYLISVNANGQNTTQRVVVR
ncbi:T9SS type A sorting domain-containing protein [Rufibacter hautae]|uniref:T9SS type A sorting domain-containing protein n=1 Tax=Rufibacter hautae TaxID=2595005 RepID=A0A5B6TC89_9BACT|nr:T9SS type A sorting domain-containing protein [Rufibacter hautae]KAA3437491.1 T9SS type A sorting domain-containing protein [Rufibacter hautae]